MEPLNDLTAGELQWSKPQQAKRTYELRQGEAVLATLASTRGSRALAQWGANQYQFSREGWLRPRVLVRDASAPASAEPLATYTQRGGTLTWPDDRTFPCKKPKHLTNERIWADAAGSELVRFHPARRLTTVVIAQQLASTLPELALLVLLGQYLLVLAAQDAEAASAAATVAVIASS